MINYMKSYFKSIEFKRKMSHKYVINNWAVPSMVNYGYSVPV